ncbi:hypothetical protein WJX81_005572 [Elliptochloris bilobata]|uniref:Methyltransferase domain-containing protein n=1 Tax=Elliptochloris bilobata TaxID=381761 RepID=A0AAW1RRX7_9CHLO
MSEELFPEDFRKLQACEQNIVRAVELAGEVVEELAKVGQADAAFAQRLCSQFLQTVKEVQDVLVAAVQRFANPAQLKNNSYLARVQASVAERKVAVVQRRLCDALRALEPEFWQRRFECGDAHEWFGDYEAFRALLAPRLAPGARVLVLGCGTSSLPLDLAADGFAVTATDIAPAAIERMRARADALGVASIQWREADMLALPFDDAAFDAVVEKGAMDVLYTADASPWAPHPATAARVHRMLGEAHRVLAPDGAFCSITFTQPHFRRPLLLAPQYTWGMTADAFGEPGSLEYQLIYCRKGARKPEDTPVHFPGAAARAGAAGAAESPIHEHMDREDYLLCSELEGTSYQGGAAYTAVGYWWRDIILEPSVVAVKPTMAGALGIGAQAVLRFTRFFYFHSLPPLILGLVYMSMRRDYLFQHCVRDYSTPEALKYKDGCDSMAVRFRRAPACGHQPGRIAEKLLKSQTGKRNVAPDYSLFMTSWINLQIHDWFNHNVTDEDPYKVQWGPNDEDIFKLRKTVFDSEGIADNIETPW